MECKLLVPLAGIMPHSEPNGTEAVWAGAREPVGSVVDGAVVGGTVDWVSDLLALPHAAAVRATATTAAARALCRVFVVLITGSPFDALLGE
jgi:hypothetical protein